MRTYPILEPELAALGLLNTVATASVSLASGAFGFGLNVVWNRMLRPTDAQADAHIDAMEKGAIGVCLVVMAVSIVVFFIAWNAKRTRIKNLATESTLGG